MRFIQRNTKAFFASEGFKLLAREGLEFVLKSDVTSVPEVEIFSASAKWAEEECVRQNLTINGTNKRQTLGDLLYQIRMTHISLKSFSNIVIPTEILTEEEQLQLYKYFTITGGSKLKCQLRRLRERRGKKLNLI